MTNNQIIFNESVRLMQEGVLSGTGHFITVQNEKGETISIEEPEVIHTFAVWKENGYSVKKGEHAIAQFTVWKYAEGSKNKADGENIEDGESIGHCFMKKAFFFKRSQVERIA